jgi:hypothetical protein
MKLLMRRCSLTLREASREAHLTAAKQMEKYLSRRKKDAELSAQEQMKLDLYIVNIIRYHYWRAREKWDHWENKAAELKKGISE